MNRNSCMNGGLQVHQIGKMLENNGVAQDLVDLRALVDEELHLHENIENVEAAIGKKITGDKESDIDELEGMAMEDHKKLLEGDMLEELYMEKKWLEIIKPQTMNLFAGGKRNGKSVLAYWLAELLHKEHKLPVYVFGLPKEKTHLLPEFISPTYDIDFPEDSIIICDEAYKEFHSREPMSQQNKQMDTIAGLVGQKNIIAMYITQLTRKLDIGIVGACDSVLWKKPSLLQMKFERPQFRKEVQSIYDRFKFLPESKVKQNTWVLSEDYEGWLINPMTSWWTEELSQAFKGVKVKKEKKTKRVSDKQLRRMLADRLQHKR